MKSLHKAEIDVMVIEAWLKHGHLNAFTASARQGFLKEYDRDGLVKECSGIVCKYIARIRVVVYCSSSRGNMETRLPLMCATLNYLCHLIATPLIQCPREPLQICACLYLCCYPIDAWKHCARCCKYCSFIQAE